MKILDFQDLRMFRDSRGCYNWPWEREISVRGLPASRNNNISLPVRVFISRCFSKTRLPRLEHISPRDVRARVGMNEYDKPRSINGRCQNLTHHWESTNSQLSPKSAINCQDSSMPFLIYVQRMLNDRK